MTKEFQVAMTANVKTNAKKRTLAQMGFKNKIQWALITPELAIEILRDHRVINSKQQDENNRKVRASVVDDYCYLMEQGFWGESNDAIFFDKNGNLINGQHRLLALAQQHNSFWFIVGTNYSHTIYMDSGQKRTPLDNFKITGSVNPKLAVSQIKNTVTTLMYHNLKGTHLYAHEIIEFMDYFETELLEFSMIISGKFRACVYSALFAAYLNGVDKDDIATFLTILKDGYSTNNLRPIAPIIALRDRLNDIKGGGGSINKEIYARTQFALHSYCAGNSGKYSMPKEFYPVSFTFLNIHGEDRFN